MRMRSHRRNVTVWHASAGPYGPYGGLRYTRRGHARRVRWWLRAGAWLAVTSATRLARIAQSRWPVLLAVTGVLVAVMGLLLRSSVAFVAGLLMAGASTEGRSPSPTAAMVRMSECLRSRHSDHL